MLQEKQKHPYSTDENVSWSTTQWDFFDEVHHQCVKQLDERIAFLESDQYKLALGYIRLISEDRMAVRACQGCDLAQSHSSLATHMVMHIISTIDRRRRTIISNCISLYGRHTQKSAIPVATAEWAKHT